MKPDDLEDPRSIPAIARAGVLWIELAEQLNQLRDEAEKLLPPASP